MSEELDGIRRQLARRLKALSVLMALLLLGTLVLFGLALR